MLGSSVFPITTRLSKLYNPLGELNHKVTKTWPLSVVPGLQLISYSLNSTDHLSIQPERLGLESTAWIRYEVKTMIVWA